MTKRLENVTWLAPELHENTADTGEYRIVNEDNSHGGLAVWVDDSPDDPSNGAGHFEPYTGKPENYHYNTRRKAAAAAAGGGENA